MERNEFRRSEFVEQEQFEKELSEEKEFAQSEEDDLPEQMEVAPGYDYNKIKQRAKQRIGTSKDGPLKPSWEKDDEEHS